MSFVLWHDPDQVFCLMQVLPLFGLNGLEIVVLMPRSKMFDVTPRGGRQLPYTCFLYDEVIYQF